MIEGGKRLYVAVSWAMTLAITVIVVNDSYSRKLEKAALVIVTGVVFSNVLWFVGVWIVRGFTGDRSPILQPVIERFGSYFRRSG
jgi:hypothetical protein